MNEEPIQPSEDDLRYDDLWELSKEELVRKLMDCEDALTAADEITSKDEYVQTLLDKIVELQDALEVYRLNKRHDF